MPDQDPDKSRKTPGSGVSAREPDAQELQALSRAAAAGDHAAIARLHARFAPGLVRLFLKRTRGRDDIAEELAQRSWTLVWESIRKGRYDPDRATMSTFVYAVANNAWLQHLRKSGRSIELNVAAEEGPDFSGPNADDAANAELLQAVREAVGGLMAVPPGMPIQRQSVATAAPNDAGLTDDERTIVRMMASGLSDRGVAAQMGLAPSTVNVKKRGALDKIKRFLAAKGHRGLE
jgi:DNA-directed RNA polymerase specialized sigma24 family protein